MKHLGSKIDQYVAGGKGCSSLIGLVADHEAVVGEFDVVGQRARLAGVEDIVVQVGKVGLPRHEFFDVGEGFLEVQMRRVWLNADAVKHQNIKPAEPIKRLRRNGLQVGRVGEIVKAISDHRKLAVDDLKRRHLDLADAKGRTRKDRVRDKLRQPAAQVGRLKNVLKNATKVDPGDLIREDRHRPVAKIQRPDVIKAEDVIDVAVSDEHRIELADICPQCLLAEIRRGIDEDRLPFMLDEDRDAEPLITRVIGETRLAIAGDRGYASRGSGSEEGKSHRGLNAGQLFLSENVRPGKLFRSLSFEFLLGRPNHRHILHPKVGEKPLEKTGLLSVEIAFRLIADHRKNVEPILACIKVKRTLPGRRVRNGTERRGRVGRKGREKIYEASRVFRSRNIIIAVLFGLIGSGGERLFFDRRDLRLGLGFGRRRLGERFRCFGLDLNALFQRAVGVELTSVRYLESDLFLIIFVSDHDNSFLARFYHLRISTGKLADEITTRGRQNVAPKSTYPRHILDNRPVLNLNSGMSEKFDELVGVMERLRAPGGCPWDAEQTYASLSQYLLEEAYETFDAIQHAEATGDIEHLKEELGDLLLQVVFHSTIGKERGEFTIEDVAEGISKKLVLRHPHVFGDANLETASDVLNNWDELKANERKASGKAEKIKESILDEVPVHFPALLEALKLTKKASKVGFDWPETDQIIDKAEEEIGELRVAISSADRENIEEEIGDLLFVIVNLARRLDVEPETALKRTNRKFRKRFGYVEKELEKAGRDLNGSTLEEMDKLWNAAKASG